MANLKQFSTTPVENGVVINARYDDDSSISFQTDKQSSEFIISVVRELAAACDRVIAAENRAAAANRTADRMRMRTGDSYDEAQPTKIDPQFMRLVRAVCPKYDEASQDDDPRLVALDVLRYAPVTAFSAVCNESLADLQPSNAITILEQVGDYMKANNIDPKPYTAADTIKAIGDSAKKLWGKK
ncbi:TPA: XRE family transcriptional regulator [Serratia marcescens]|nr:XRE family transcriptional regulator [Serratia marcescens]